MLVCLCFAVSDREIRRLVKEENCASVREIQKECMAGSKCGTCVKALQQEVERCKKETGHIRLEEVRLSELSVSVLAGGKTSGGGVA